MGMGIGIDFKNSMGMGMGMGVTFENGYECGYSYTRPKPAPRPSVLIYANPMLLYKSCRLLFILGICKHNLDSLTHEHPLSFVI